MHVKFLRIFTCLAILSIPTACIVNEFCSTSFLNAQISTLDRHGETPTEAKLWQTDPVLRQYAQYQLRGKSPVGKNGAIARNQQYPEQVQLIWQRTAFEIVAYGIAVKSKPVIREGLKAFQWSFENQSPDGSFGISEYPEVMAFFGAYSRTILVLRDVGLKQEADRLTRYLPQMQKYLNHPEFSVWEKHFEQAQARNPMTNQLFWAAFSYHLVNLVQPNPKLENKARSWLNQGLKMQRADGSFPEKGGSDTNYQSVNLKFLSLYSFYSSKEKDLIKPHISKGFTWLNNKVLPDGTMDVSNNSRTGRNREIAPTGKFKDGRFGDPIIYVYWSHLGGGSEARQMAMRVFTARRTQTRQS